jgi:hypothetical protein
LHTDSGFVKAMGAPLSRRHLPPLNDRFADVRPAVCHGWQRQIVLRVFAKQKLGKQILHGRKICDRQQQLFFLGYTYGEVRAQSV